MITPIRGFTRSKTRLPPAILAFALLALTGCDDLEEIEPEDQRIQVGVFPAAVCPEGVAGVPGDGIVAVRATVYAGDGTTAEDSTVTLTASRGAVVPGDAPPTVRGMSTPS